MGAEMAPSALLPEARRDSSSASGQQSRGHDGIEDAALVDVPWAGESSYLYTYKADQRNKVAAEEELNSRLSGLMVSAAFVMPMIFSMASQQPAGDQILRSYIYHLCNVVAVSQAMAVMLVVCLYRREIVPADRAMVAARACIVRALISMTLAYSISVSEDWLGTATIFFGIVATTAFVILYDAGGLKEYLLKIGRVF